MFEQRYTEANDRIHPRQDLLQEMQKKWAAEEAARVRIIIDAPQNYPTYGVMITMERQIRSLESEVASLKNSLSYRVGRMITALPRRLKDIVRK